MGIPTARNTTSPWRTTYDRWSALSVDDIFRFSVISAFCGAGGSSCGYKLAGGEVLLGIDIDADAVATYRDNFPHTTVYHGDIAGLSVDECCRLAQVRPGEIDVLDASPPCQGFSTLGNRRFADHRNQFFQEFVQFVRGLRPKTVVLENVSGMVKGKMKVIFVECLRELKASGYKVRARLLDTQYFHVPQIRQRIIFIGVRGDLVGVEPSHPKAQSTPQSLRQALGLLGNGGIKNDQFDNKWRSLDDPCVTLGRHPPILLLNGECRKLTVGECSTISGFPPDWKWGDKAHYLIGNSVPPPFMAAVAAGRSGQRTGGSE